MQVREVDFRFQRLRYCPVLTTVIERDGVADIFIATQHQDDSAADFSSLFGEHFI